MTSKTNLILANLAATYLTYLTTKSPNPPPKNPHTNDRLFNSGVLLSTASPKLGSAIFVALSGAHICLIAKGITPDSPPSTLCPNPQNVNIEYFRWSRYVETCLFLIVGAAGARLAAYRALGGDFTFELAKPSGLKTSGIYRYVQHPSYLPLIVIVTANMALFGNVDGAMGCLLPSWFVEQVKGWKWAGLGFWVAIWVRMIWARVVDEEGMLKEVFGKEWVEWNRRTARFIPFVF